MRNKNSGKLIKIKTYSELLAKISELSINYPEYVLYYRGQTKEYFNSKNEFTLLPSLYRPDKRSVPDLEDSLITSTKELKSMINSNKIAKNEYLKNKKMVLWSLLQHYEICGTPFLDVTDSLITACSFATLGENNKAYLYVLALPYLSNRITIDTENDIILIRLLSVSPTEAKRPYYQNGYVVATDNITSDYDSKEQLDFNRRVIARFEFENTPKFWDNTFRPLKEDYLYPSDDKFIEFALELMQSLAFSSEYYMKKFIEDIFKKYKNQGVQYYKELIELNVENDFRNKLTNLEKLKYDFIVKYKDEIYIIKSNLYKKNSSKINEVIKINKKISDDITSINKCNYIWIVDGKGWNSVKGSKMEPINEIKYVYGIDDIKNGVMKNIFK